VHARVRVRGGITAHAPAYARPGAHTNLSAATPDLPGDSVIRQEVWRHVGNLEHALCLQRHIPAVAPQWCMPCHHLLAPLHVLQEHLHTAAARGALKDVLLSRAARQVRERRTPRHARAHRRIETRVCTSVLHLSSSLLLLLLLLL